MFRDVIQTVMEVELDEERGRERCQQAVESGGTPNYRNGHTKKTVKTQFGQVDIRFSPALTLSNFAYIRFYGVPSRQCRNGKNLKWEVFL